MNLAAAYVKSWGSCLVRGIFKDQVGMEFTALDGPNGARCCNVASPAGDESSSSTI